MNKWLEWKETLVLAEKLGKAPRDVEREHLRKGVVPLRYQRNHDAISQSDQIRLMDSRVGVCGCGALGLYVVNYLARLGVGHITIWDPDVFRESNLNRQLFSSYETLGKSKVEICRAAIEQINPTVQITAIPSRWEESDMATIRRQQVIVEALDDIPARLALAQVCEEENIPMVHGAIGGWYGQLTVIMPGDHSLQGMYKDSSSYSFEENEGALSFTAALLAGMQAAEAIKLLLNWESELRHTVYIVDLLNLDIERIFKDDLIED